MRLSIRQSQYSIGILEGKTPFKLEEIHGIRNPVLQAKDVTDIRAGFVADPFMVQKGDKWFMFFEVLNLATDRGDIACAVSDDGLHWRYERVVLAEAFHLSYPYVFEWEGVFFMIPETVAIGEIRLYRSNEFPYKWIFEKALIKGYFYDSSIVRHQGRWWIFTSDSDDTLRVFFSEDFVQNWKEHPKSPVVRGNAKIARSAGRLLDIGGKIYRFAQDCEIVYGYQVRGFEILKLTVGEYEEREVDTNPILKATGKGWNGQKMHQVDAHQIGTNRWLACVDGRGQVYGLKWR